jgi:hypothetical protein
VRVEIGLERRHVVRRQAAADGVGENGNVGSGGVEAAQCGRHESERR